MPATNSKSQSPKSLRQIADRIDALVVALRETAKRLEAAGVKTIHCKQDGGRKDGLKRLTKWANEVLLAADEAMELQGVFDADDTKKSGK